MRRRSLQLARRAPLAGAWLLACAVGCGAPVDDSDGLGDEIITVRPRVAIDGLIELSSRTDGRLFVDEVVIHAPSVEIRDGAATVADLLSSDPLDDGPLFFRYALADSGAAGSAIAGERHWRLNPPGATASSEVVFGFSPFSASRAGLDELAARYGHDFADLNGYTAYVHGYVSVDRGLVGGLSAGTRSAGDPETDPAKGDEAAGDPETDPAKGDEAAGDPETDPAKGHNAAGDPETDPAKGDEAAGDPETDPARGRLWAGDPETDPARGFRASMDRTPRDGVPGLGNPYGRGGELVPFLLVFEEAAEMRVPLLEVGLSTLDDDEYLPIHLHVDVNRLFSHDRLTDLDAEAQQVLSGGEPLIMLPVDANEADQALQLELQQDRVRERPRQQPAGGIDIQGDLRSEEL